MAEQDRETYIKFLEKEVEFNNKTLSEIGEVIDSVAYSTSARELKHAITDIGNLLGLVMDDDYDDEENDDDWDGGMDD